MLRLRHGSSLHRLELLLLILVHVDSLGIGHLLLVVDLCGDTLLLIVILILEVAHEGILHVLAFNEKDVCDAKNDEDGAQNGHVNDIIYAIPIVNQACNPE